MNLLFCTKFIKINSVYYLIGLRRIHHQFIKRKQIRGCPPNRFHLFDLLKNGFQTASLMGLSDAFVQSKIEKHKKIDFHRSAKFASIGGFYIGPVLTTWFRFLDRLIRTRNLLHRMLVKLALDQLLFTPVFLGSVIAAMSFVKTLSPHDVIEKIKQHYPDVLVANYAFWPAAQGFNLTFVPIKLQVLFNQMIGVVWNIFLQLSTSFH